MENPRLSPSSCVILVPIGGTIDPDCERGKGKGDIVKGKGDIVDVRHEVVTVAVSRCGATTTPAVLPAVFYRDRRCGQPPGRKLPGQRSLIPRDGGPGRESCLRL